MKKFIIYWKTKIVDVLSSWKLQKQLFLKNEHSKLLKGWKQKKKQAFFSLLFVLVIPTGFFLLISSFLANSLRSLVLYYFFRRITPAQKFNKTSPLAVKTTGASVVFILEPIITKVIWLRNPVGIVYQYKKPPIKGGFLYWWARLYENRTKNGH